MTASILLDWAFGYAAGASGPELDAFLDMREDLRRALSRGRGLAEALARMEAIGRWGRIYCVYDLCCFLRDREAATEAATAKRILLALVVAEDEDLQRILKDAIRDAAASSNPSEVIQSLEAAAARWLRVEDPSNFSTRLDYSDVEIFVGPTVILGLAVVLSQNDGIASSPSGALERLAAAALSGAYGRLPFNLAVEWAIASPALFDAEDVSDALLATPHGRLQTSPDLIIGLVRWTFLCQHSDLDRAGLLEALERELMCLTSFRRYFGVPARAELGVVYWQDAIITLMLDIDLDVAAKKIANFWTPRIHLTELHTRVTVPLTVVPADLAVLLNQIYVHSPGSRRRELDILANPSEGLANSWPVISPWLAERGWQKQETPHRLRWLCGLAVDIRLLESRTFDQISPPFVTHLIASLPLLRQYAHFSQHREISAWRADVSPTGHLGWLSRHAWNSAIEALSGHGRPGCRDILFVVEDLCAPSFLLAGVTRSTVGEKLSDLRRRTTTGALRLLEDAIAASTNSAWSPWLDAAEDVVALHAGQIGPELKQHDLLAASAPPPRTGNAPAVPDDLIVYGLLRRYLTPTSAQPTFVDNRILAEVHAGEGAAGSWAVPSRRLLLAPTDESTVWIGPGDECGDPDLPVRLARALMRVTAAHEDQSLSPALTAQWRANLDLVLREITDPVQFDRFARLKLIRMVADGVFDGDDDLLILVLTTLLHYGGPFHVRAVEQTIVEHDFAKAPQVRAALFLALTRQNLSKRLFDADGDEDVISLKDQMLEQLRAACLYADQDTRKYLANEARALEEQTAREGFRSATADIKARKEGLYSTLTLSDKTDWIAPVTAEMVAIDATSARALVLHRPRSASGDVNAFAGMSAHGPARHLGIVERKRNPARIYVRFSPGKTVVSPDVASSIKEIGDLVIIDSADANLDREMQEAAGIRKVIKLDGRDNQPRLTHVSVRRNGERPASAVAQIGPLKEVDWTTSTFNFAGLYLAIGNPYRVRADRPANNDSGVLPQTRDFADLLLDYPALGLDQTITLSMHEVSTNEVGELASIVVEARPFERYRVYASLSLTQETRNALTKELERLRDLQFDPRGLLMTIRVASMSGGPAIHVVNGKGDVTAFDFPELECPFDHRNLVWRERFSGQVQALRRNDALDVPPRSLLGVHISRRRYSTSILAPPGLPEQVHIILDEPCTEKTAFLDPDPTTWNPWRAEIWGVVEREASLSLPKNPQDRAAAIRSLHALKSGQRISILSVSRSIRDDGRVYGFSDTNLQVLVNAETITLALPWDSRLSFSSPGRSAILTHIEWRPSDIRILIRSEDVPAAVVSRSTAKAMITRLPPIKENQVTCGVAWFDTDGSGIVEASLFLQFSNLGRRLPLGAMIEVALADGGAQARIFEPFGIADAIWCQDPEVGRDGAPPDGILVGTLQHQGAAWDVHETGAGRFVLHRSELAGARASLRRQFGLADGQDDIAAIEQTRDRPRDRIWGAIGRRCALDCGSLGVVAGTTASDIIGGALRLSGLQLSMTSAFGGEGWLIERRFLILKDRHRAAPLQKAAHTARVEPEEEAPRIALGDVVSGRFEPRTSTLILSGDLRRRCPNGVLIAPDAIQRAPVLPGVHYPGRRAKAKIISLDPLLGSFITAPECSLQDLALDLQAARPDDGSLGINPGELRLVFVGREDASVDALSPAKGRYMFEWGYGRWVGLGEDQVRYDGGPIQNAKLLLFYGDRISAGDVTEECLLIESIAPSRGHVLYRQSRDHKVVNLLRVIAGRNGEPTIDAIMGFDPDIERQIVGGTLPHARLDSEGLRRVCPRLVDGLPQRVLGRLDTKQFEDSCGQTLLFNFRRLDLNDEQFGLSVGDRVFVAAGSIQKKRNDVLLMIRDPGLHPDDADPSFLPGKESSQLMLRRAFSIRQQTLGDILELDGANKLKDSTLLVRLEKRGPSLVEGALLRNPEIVRQRLRRGEEVLGVFGGGLGKHCAIELSPGVMVGLPQGELVQTGGFYRGDVVIMRATDDGRISLALAWPSDLRFVREGRPAILLPRDTLARRDAFPPYGDLRARRLVLNAFSVGDLPDLSVSARAWQPDGRIGEITDDQFASFMCRPHPKIGELHFSDRDNPERQLHFTPGIGTQTIVGQVVSENNDAVCAPRVRVVEFGGEVTEHPSDWYLLSYADVSAAELVWPVTKGEKQFHDRQTTVWKRAIDGKLHANSMSIPPVTAGTGPLFFSVRSDGVVTLRRPANELAKFASGPSALLPLLSRTQSGRRPVQVTVAEAASDHLLVEHYPGQFLQLSAGMLQFRTPSGRLSMRALDYTQFAAGDRVALTTDEPADSLTVVKLNVSWTHGPRNAFGPSGALLERDEVNSDATEGVALYGIGRLTVGLPCQNVDALPVRAVVGGEQHLTTAPQDPRDLRGCTVLLFIDGAEEKIRVHGVPWVNFAPSQGWSWDEDSLFRGAVRGAGRSLTFHREELLIRLRLAGGALPFTVERCGSEGQDFLELSRRHQNVKFIDQRIVRAVVEGQMGSARQVQLRIGGRHLALPTTALLAGVRPAEESAVFTALARKQHSVWLRSQDKGFVSGHGAGQSGAFTVTPREVVRQEHRFLGVVCEGLSDGRLYWLAANDAAAFIYSGDEAEKVFSSNQMRRLKVVVLPSGAVSIMQHPSAIAEVDRLRLGASTFVDCTGVDLQIPAWAAPHTASEWKLRVCVSKQTSVTFGLAADPRHFERKSLQTEVAVRRVGRSGALILLAAANERIVVSEAPSWLFAASSPPWTGAVTRFLAPSTAINGLTSVVEAFEGRGELPTAEDIIAMARIFVSTEWVGTFSGVALCAGLKARDPRLGNPVRKALVGLLRNLFGRSIRSAPLEVLAVWALRPPGEVSAFTAGRRRQLLELFRGGRLDAARAAVDRWLRAIDLEGVKPEEEALANAFGVLIGRAGKAEILVREARFISTIITATRAVGVGAEVMDETLDSAIGRLVQVAADLRDRQFDIPLLPPLQLFDVGLKNKPE